jgi:hypothetical protein
MVLFCLQGGIMLLQQKQKLQQTQTQQASA